MKSRKWLALVVVAIFSFSASSLFADRKDHNNGHGNGHWRDKGKDHDDTDDRRGYGFAAHDRDQIRGWYASNYRHLPPGLAKRDRLPPGLERQLEIHAEFPAALQAHISIVPVDLERRLPPPPPDCERVVVGGHIVLMNRRTKIVLDIFHFE